MGNKDWSLERPNLPHIDLVKQFAKFETLSL